MFTPQGTYYNRIRPFDDFVVIGNVRLDVDQWAALTPALLQAGEDVIDRFFWQVQGKLEPAIELERETVIKF